MKKETNFIEKHCKLLCVIWIICSLIVISSVVYSNFIKENTIIIETKHFFHTDSTKCKHDSSSFRADTIIQIGRGGSVKIER